MTISKLTSYLLIILTLMIIGSIVKSGMKSLEAEDRLSDMQSKVDKLEEQNQVLVGGSDKYMSADFIEKQIRNKLKLVKPGEKVVILPAELSEKTEEAQYSFKEVEETVVEDVAVWKQWVALFW